MTPVRDSRKRGTSGVDPRKGGIGPYTPPVVTYELDGYTRDYDTRAILPSCDVFLHLTSTRALVASTTSDANGHFLFDGLPEPPVFYYIDAYLTGSPDMAGTSRNDLVAA